MSPLFSLYSISFLYLLISLYNTYVPLFLCDSVFCMDVLVTLSESKCLFSVRLFASEALSSPMSILCLRF